ncbi:putative RNA-directed DNA polymerase from transposon X-element [Nephila pilipes]|uniref:Putative RNA-directed DNA polymerase from transposon X-element n=1 Tax=Nephila pilipes TaxID=299642 RepID=A0A8X6PWH6_NEPPI|nr:putative RNA-directed DNA polymerase from transposon X-element [Nephila pilipes]
MKILSWNCNSIRPKKQDFQDFIQQIDRNTIALQETRLKSSDRLNLPNYTTHRTDKTIYTGGGTALMIKSSIPHHATPINTTLIEGTVITIERRNSTPISIISVYKSPRKPMDPIELRNLFQNRWNCLIVGDLNAKL